MSQQVTQSVSTPLLVILSKNNVAVTGLVAADLTCQFLKSGAGSFASKALTGGNFAEKGLGIYTITFTTAELNTLGPFTVVLTGAAIDQSTTIVDVVAPTATTVPAAAAQLCTLTGHVVNVQGVPKAGAAVTAFLLGQPSIEQYSLAVTDDTITVLTDANGYFAISLMRLADVEIVIPAVNYRRRLVVPNVSSADLFTDIV